MATEIKELPGFRVVATGNNIQVQPGQPPQYLVPNIAPYPNNDFIVGNTYKISDPINPGGIVVELVHAPGGGMRTATFQPQT